MSAKKVPRFARDEAADAFPPPYRLIALSPYRPYPPHRPDSTTAGTRSPTTCNNAASRCM